MKKFKIQCDFGGQRAPFDVYVGDPRNDKHPLQMQAWWLSSSRGGSIPQEIMDSFEKLQKIAQENNVSFEDLCVYAFGNADEGGNASGGGGFQQQVQDSAAVSSQMTEQKA